MLSKNHMTLKQTQYEMASAVAKKITMIKCVIWDLDNTVWDGILLEGDVLQLRSKVVDAITVLDAYGILNAIASRYKHTLAIAQLQQFHIDHFFIYPQQIN